MLILAIDTSTELGTVALVREGRALAEVSARVRARHGEVLLPHVQHVLELAQHTVADLDLIAVGLGPGSFTGCRIGVSTAKGLALAADKPIRGVVSLRAVARAVPGPGAVIAPLFDAHKGEIYAAAYRPGTSDLEEVVAPFHAEPAQVAAVILQATRGETLLLSGDGFRRYEEELTRELPAAEALPPSFDVPRASFVAEEALERFERDGPSDLAELEPLYLRPSDAKLPEKRLKIEPTS